MSINVFDSLTMYHEAAVELHARLEEAREAMSDEEWDAANDGPLGEILCAAMDVEYYAEKFMQDM